MHHIEQLSLPLVGTRDYLHHSSLIPVHRVFVNRSVNLANVSWIGFDLDDTLAVYNHERIDSDIINLIIDRLRSRGYPQNLSQMHVDTSFAMRGLHIDTVAGHIIKLSRHQVPCRAYHGLHPVPVSLFQGRCAKRIDFSDARRFCEVDTLWAACVASLFASLVHESERNSVEVNYCDLLKMIRTCLEQVYIEGHIDRMLLANLPVYVQRESMLAPMLHNLRSSGKKLFLLTNSPWQHVDGIMSYLLRGAMAEYPSWQHYFELVVTSADKPGFFNDRKPFAKTSQHTLSVSADRSKRDKNRMLQAGNVYGLCRLIRTRAERVLFIGDHLTEDIQAPAQSIGWKGMLIVPELRTELEAYHASTQQLQRMAQLDIHQDQLENELRNYHASIKEQTRLADIHKAQQGASSTQMHTAKLELQRLKRSIDRVRLLLRQVQAETTHLEHQVASRFHPHWGSMLREGTELTNYGYRISQSASLYTMKATNLQAYSPTQRFRAQRQTMAHEVLQNDT